MNYFRVKLRLEVEVVITAKDQATAEKRADDLYFDRPTIRDRRVTLHPEPGDWVEVMDVSPEVSKP